MPAANYDLLVIGGGINGAGIARDAAGRGLSVLLVEQGDLGAATSSASSKLIHGGLRYLEQYEFRLVAESLAEREVLLGIAAHLTSPLRFVMPHVPELRPRWMIRLGLFLYDHLARRSLLPASRRVRLDAPPYSEGLRRGCATGSSTRTAPWTTRAWWWRTRSTRAHGRAADGAHRAAARESEGRDLAGAAVERRGAAPRAPSSTPPGRGSSAS